MITRFKIFENNNIETSFIIDDLIPYFSDKVELWELPFIEDNIIELLYELFDFPEGKSKVVEFYCDKCSETIDGVTNYIHFNKKHKGKIRGFGFGMDKYPVKIHISLRLDKLKYKHVVNTSKPITIYGEIPIRAKDIIEEVNLLANTKKYNL